MADKIEIPVSLGLQAATQQIQELRAILEKSVDIKSTAFKSIDQALSKALNQVNNLKASMSTAFQNTSSAKKFSADLERTFQQIQAIGESFGNLGQKDLIFSPEAKTQIDDLQNQMRNLNAEISRISAGRIGNIFDDSSIENFRQVQNMAAQLGVVLSKTTFEDFSSQISNKMAEVRREIESTKASVENLKNATNNPTFTKDSLFQSLTEKTDLSNIIEKQIDATSAKDLREKIAAAYSNVGLEINEALVANVKSGQGIDTVLKQQTENLVISATAFETAAKEKKQEISQVIEDLTGLTTNSNRYGNSGQTYNRNEKLGLIQDIKTKYANLIDFSKFDELDPNKMGIREYIRQFQEALEQGFKNIDGSTIEKALKENISAAINSALTKDVITDTKSFQNQVQTVLKGIFGNQTFDIPWSSFKGSTVDKAFSDIIQNITNTIASFDPTAASEKIQQLEQSLQELKSVQETVNNTATADGSKLQGLQDNYNNLATAVASVVQETLKALGVNVSDIFARTADSAHGATSAVNSATDSLAKFESRQKSLGNIQTAVNRWMGFWQVLNMTKSAINEMKQHIQELDSVMTSISVVTNFSQEDLWGQISQYSEIARQYGVAIKGVYEVSQIYYQQGLQQNDVMTLTTETLKMARIAGLDYATAADYMTTAIRGFKLEMTDAAHVTDVFSALAATTASSTEEIAVAISKTAASAAAVGASFEATSAMMATMIATTRESATNIGTALKSVISRYGEMTSDPSKTVDSEGEEMSLNRVDKALQTVGITIHDTAGQFRDFDDVMLELMEKWDSLDSLSQRYIATLMAGNRQQSRFLALVSNVDEYKKALQTAMDSEGTGELQTLKTLDSIDAKIEKMKVTIQEFYTSSGLEELYKNILDTITNIVVAANSLPKMFGKIPGQAIAIGASIISTIKSVLTLFISSISNGLDQIKGKNTSLLQAIVEAWGRAGTESATKYNTNQQAVLEQGYTRHRRMENPNLKAGRGKTSKELSPVGKLISTYAGAAASIIGSLFTATSLAKYGASSSIGQDKEAGLLGILGGLSSIGGGALTGLATGGPLGAAIGAIASAVTQLPSIASAVDMISVSSTRRVELAEKAATEAKTEATKQKAETSNLAKAVDTYKELEAKAYSSAEAMQEFKDHMNTLAESYPNLISRMDESGNYIVELETLEGALAAAREKTAIATANATKAELNTQQENQKLWNEAYSASNYTYWGNDNSYKHYDEAWAEKQGSWNELWRGYGFTDEFEELGKTAKDRLLSLYNLLFPDREQLTTLGDFNNTEVRNKINEAVNEYQNLQISKMRENLKTQVEALQKVDSSLTTQYLTGFDTIDNLKDSEIILAIQKLHSVAQDHIDFYTNSINNVAKILVSQTTGTYLTQMQNHADITDLFDYDQHSSLIKSLVSGKQSLQWLSQSTTDEGKRKYEKSVKDITTKYVDFFKLHEEMATWLENLDLGQIKSQSELKTLLKEHITDDESKIDEEIRLYFLNLYEENSTQIKDNFLSALQSSFTQKENGQEKQLISSDIYNKFANLVDQSADEFGLVSVLNASLSNYISSLMPTFSSMVNNTPIMAEIILDNIANLFTSIGTLDSSMQAQISSIITNIDFFDSDSIQMAINSLEGLGPDFNNIITWLGALQKNLVINVKTQSISLQSELTQYGKSIEQALSNYNKEFSYSEILEQAFSLIDNDSSLTLDSLITQTKNGKFIFTDIGIDAQLKQAKEKESTKLQELRTATESKLRYIQELIEAPEEEISDIISSEEKYDEDGLLISEDVIEFNYDKAKQFLGKKYQGKELDSRLIELEQLYTNWSNLEESVRGSFSNYLLAQSSDLTDIINSTITIGEQLDSLIADSYLQSFDYKSLVSGGSTDQTRMNLKTLLSSVISDEKKDSFGAKFDEEIYPLLIQGKIDEYNAELESFGLNKYKVSKTDANRARFEGLKSLYNTLIDDNPVWAALDNTQKTLLESIGINEEKYNTEGVSSAVAAVWAELGILTDGVIANIDELRKEIAEKAEENFKDSKAGKQYDLLSKFEGGFTAPEAAELGLLDKETGRLKSQFTQYLRQDETGNFVMRAGQNAADVIYALAQLLDIYIDTTTDQYKDTISKSIDDGISNRQKENKGKQIAQQLKTFSEASIGDEIRIDSLTDSMKSAIGVDATATTLTIESEARRDALLLLLEESIKTFNGDGKEVLLNLYSQIKKSTTSRHNKYAGISKILSERFSLADAEAFAISQGSDPTTIIQDLRGLGIEYNEWTEEFVINSQKDIDSLLLFINALPNIDQHSEEFQQLLAQVNNLKTSLQNKQYNAVQDIVENYDNLSEESIAAFSTAFEGLGINIRDYVTTDKWGKNKVDLAALNQKLAAVGYNVNELFQQEITKIGDSYLQNISTGVSLLSSGTNNLADIGAFVESYNETMGTNLLAENISYYDDILKGFTIRPEFIRAYIQKQAENLKAQGILPEEKVDQWVQDNTTEFARENIDIGSFLSSERTQDDTNKLGKAIQNYYEFLGNSIDVANIEAQFIINDLQQGGNKAVEIAQKLKPNLTETELAEIYSNAINRWNEAFNQVENIVAGQVVTGELRQVLASLDMVDENGVVKETFDMVSVYAAIYNKMKSTAGATTADLNNAYAKLLTARDQKNIDTMDALENAANMSFDALAQLFNNFNHNLEAELPQLLKDNTVGLTGFGGIRIFNFKAFAEQLGLAENSPEYYEAYSKYADSMADFYNSTNNIIDNVAEQIKGLADAKPGKAINVSYLQQMLGDKFSEAIEGYGYMIQDGIMVLNQGADIPGLIATVANKAAEAGQILPEQLAELVDAVAEVLSQITSLITGGISGNLKNADALKLQDWATQHGLGKLDFTQTADGLKLSNDSAKQLYNTMNNIDSIQGQIAFKALKESLIESDDSFKSISASASKVASIEKDLNYEVMKKEIQSNGGRVSLFDKMNGNVDLYNRPILNNGDGSYSTLLTTTLDSRNYETDIPWVMNVTPITKDGKKLDDGALGEYIQKLIDGTDGSLEAILEADAKDLGLIIELADAAGKDQDALANSMGDRAEILHEISEAYEAIKNGETFDDTKIKQYQEELNLLREIQAERATTEDASFKFMENAIPSGQNNPLNYYENWGKAWKALQTGVKEGSMAYQDWYNIITEMNNIAGASGQTIEIAGVQLNGSMEAAAAAIQKGAKALKVTADGSIKVDLSGFGIDLAAGANSMQEGVDKGIDAIADSQIKMLDSMIQLMETIVAMEQLGDITGEDNEINIKDILPDIKWDDQGNVIAAGEFSEGYAAWRQSMIDQLKLTEKDKGYNKDLQDALKGIFIGEGENKFSLADIINWNETKFAGADKAVQDAYMAMLTAFSAAAKSGDYDLDNIMASVKQVLAGTGYEGEIDIGDMHLTFKQGYVLERDSEGHYIVDNKKFNDEETALNAMAANQLEDLLGQAKDIDTETGEVTYHGAMDATVKVDVTADKTTYTAHVGEYTVTSTSREGIAAAIKTATMLSGKDWEDTASNAENTDNALTYTIQQNASAVVNVTVDTKVGTVTYSTDNPDLGRQRDSKILLEDLEQHQTQVKDIVQNIKVGTDEAAEALDKNKEDGESKTVNQDITNEKNATGDALQANADLAAQGVSQAITMSSNAVRQAILDNQIFAKNHPAIQQLKVSKASGTAGGGKTITTESNVANYVRAAGTLGLAKSKGTLMGELGPELVVSKGRYFVVGQSGPEMVDLADDAIVFNHLQTQSLLTKGMSSERGHAVTNERNAVSFATGNVDGGPAMASASAALNALKQLRDMWEALKSASVSDLAGAGGGGGGGGGGDKTTTPKEWVKTVERWYNLMQEIAKLEAQITHEEALRSKIQSDFGKNGKHYFQSQKRSLEAIQQQIAAQEQLNLSRESYFDKRRESLKDTPLGQIYTFDEDGQMKFRKDLDPNRFNGFTDAMEWRTWLTGFTPEGKARYTNKQKYDQLIAAGMGEYMLYDSNGSEIRKEDFEDEDEYYYTVTQQVLDRIDDYQETTQSLHDSIEEGQTQLLELQEQENELLQEMRDNQMELEDEVLKAIEDMRQREIDALQDERDKLEESTGKYIQGLSDALNKEQEMYNNQEQENDLNQQRRRLAILQRSGGSAADIANLQNEINSNERSQYFDLQQQQIDAIQNASDLQIERMDDQIQLMTETLEYQKEYGLLWSDVYQVMNKSAAEIANFIMNGNAEFWNLSPLGNATKADEILFSAERWEAQKKDLDIMAQAVLQDRKEKDYQVFNNGMIASFGKDYDKNGTYSKKFREVYEETGDLTAAENAARKAYEEDKKAEEEKKKAAAAAAAEAAKKPAIASASTPAVSNNSSNTHPDAHLNDGRGKLLKYEYSDAGDSGHNKIPVYSIAGKRTDRATLEAHDMSTVSTKNGATTYSCSKCGHYMGTKKSEEKKKEANTTANIPNISYLSASAATAVKKVNAATSIKIPTKTSTSKVLKKIGFSEGGIDDATGWAILHGTKSHPEAVFNAAQTKVLRENILSNKPNSLVTLLNTYNEAYKDGISVAPQEASEQLIIENATVNMNVQQIANDYDARRAGEQALNEMMRIARKTSAANSIRR